MCYDNLLVLFKFLVFFLLCHREAEGHGHPNGIASFLVMTCRKKAGITISRQKGGKPQPDMESGKGKPHSWEVRNMDRKFKGSQSRQIEKLVGDVLASLAPDKDELQERVLAAPERSALFQQRVREVLVAMLARYFISLTDEEAFAWLMEDAGQEELYARQIITGCRKGAREQGFADNVPCHYAVEAGATLKFTIPTLGLCVDDFRYLQGWAFPDTPTERCLVSGVPTALREAASQNITTQLRTLAAVEVHWGVPTGFFSQELLPTVYTAGVALMHHKVTKRDMFNGLWVRTGTCIAGGRRLRLDWRGGRLGCGRWSWDVGGNPRLAVAALGVTKALEH